MRLLPGALLVLGLALPSVVHADPIQYRYTFTGVFDDNLELSDQPSYLDLGNGKVSLSGVAFTVTGLIGETCCGDLGGETFPVWDFGELGTLVTESVPGQGSMVYRQEAQLLDGVRYETIGLYGWYPGTIDFQGFYALVDTGQDPAVITTIETTTPLATRTGRNWGMGNNDGQSMTVTQPFNSLTGTVMTITSARVEAVPEPATLLLLSMGSAGLLAYRRKRQH